MRLALSLCNLRADSRYGVLVFDTDSKDVTPIDTGVELGTSVTGLTLRGNELLVASTTKGISELTFLDVTDLSVLEKKTLHQTRDIHSIAVRDDMLYVVSTGADAVLRYKLDGRRLQFAGTVWGPTLGIDDSMHLNGLSTAEGRFMCSGFGLKEGARWSTARDGFVFDLDANAMVTTGIYHPHSVTSFQGNVFCLESVTGHLAAPKRSLWSVDGYARGLCFYSEGKAAIGSSVARRSSDGKFQNAADGGEPVGTCAITLIDIATGSRTTISLAEYNNEIYDIIALP